MEETLALMESEELYSSLVQSPTAGSSSSAPLFRWEHIFGENMLVIQQDNRDWLVGVQVAVLLNRETYNLYRSMKNKGITMERASIQQIDQLLAQDLVKAGTRSITLIPLEQARSFILEDQQRVEKRKQTKQTSKKPYEVMRTKLVQTSPSSSNASSYWKQGVQHHPPVQVDHSKMQRSVSDPSPHLHPQLPPPSLPQQLSFGVPHKEKKGEICRPIAIHATMKEQIGNHMIRHEMKDLQLNRLPSSTSWNQFGMNPSSNSWNKVLSPRVDESNQSQLPHIGDMLPHLFSGKDSPRTSSLHSSALSPLKISSIVAAPIGEEVNSYVTLPTNSPRQVWIKNVYNPM